MLTGRFLVIVPALAIAGSLAAKKTVPASAGSLPTHGGLFVGLLVGVILIVGGLTYFPALALGPIVEHLAMLGRPDLLIGIHHVQNRKTALLAPEIVVPAARLGPRQARPARDDPQPGDVRRRGRRRSSPPSSSCATSRPAPGEPRLQLPDRPLALVHALFANFAEAVAEGRGKAQADAPARHRAPPRPQSGCSRRTIASSTRALRPRTSRSGDVVLVEAGDVIPGDGEVIEGVASVNEAAITGESAPVIRESGGDRSAVTGGTTVISDRLIIRITSRAGTPSSTG